MASPERAPARRRAPRWRREPNRPPAACLRCFSFSSSLQAADRQAATSQVHSGGATAATIAHGLDPDNLDSRRGTGRRRIHRPRKWRRREAGPRDARGARGMRAGRGGVTGEGTRRRAASSRQGSYSGASGRWRTGPKPPLPGARREVWLRWEG